MDHALIPVILAGGSGTRLWPLSRQLYPKQFLPLFGEKTMLQQTVERLDGLRCGAPILIVTKNIAFCCRAIKANGIDNATILLEPFPKNTAPAIALAAFRH